MHHGGAGTAHPDALGGRSDLDRGAGQHGDGVTWAYARCGQPSGHATGPLVHLGPGMADRRARFPGDHALRTRQGVAIHRFSESTQDNPLGLGVMTPCVGCSGNPARNCGCARRWIREPLGFGRRPALLRGPTMSVEVRVSSVFIPDGRSLRLERPAVLVRLTDCTEPDYLRTPERADVGQVVMNSECIGEL